jgi:hypothetical protein
MRAYRPLPLLLLILLPAIAAAQVFSWKDASGKVHYGDRPPAEKQVASRKLAPPPAPTADEEAALKASADRKTADGEKQKKAAEEAKKNQEDPEQAKQRAEGCQQARQNLSGLESGQIRYTVDAKGERTGLDGAVRDAEIAKARKAVDSWCNPPKPPAK